MMIKNVRLGMDMDCGDFVLVAFEGSKELRVFLLLNHGLLLL